MHPRRAITRDTIHDEIMWRRSSGFVPYIKAVDTMAARVQAIRDGQFSEQVWLLEHPPLFTAGTSAKSQHLMNPRGFPTYEAGRGGQWTYHGPGQRIAYVMLDLMKPHGEIPPRDLRAFVGGLERWIIAALKQLGIEAGVREGRIGVWALDPVSGNEAKIAALGIRVSRWVTWHGVSINLNPDLSDFGGIVPCGISDYGVTSIMRWRPDVTMPQLDAALACAWEFIFGTQPSLTNDDQSEGAVL